MSSLTSAGTAVRLARIRNNDIFNTLVANPRWSLSSDPNSIKSDSEFIKPSVPFMPQYGKPTKGRYGRFKVLAHLVSALTVNHDDNKWQILADLFADGLTGIDRIVLVGTANKFRLGLWIAVFATLVITTLYFITLTVIEYWQYNTIVSVTLVGRNPDILPAITICNLNPFRKDVLCDPDGAFYSVRQSICEESKNSEQFAYHMTRFRTHSATNKTLAAFIEKSKYTWEDIVISCSFNQEDCKSDWVQEETVSFYRYGRCFCMFCNLTAVNENVRFFLSSGRLHGLNLVLNSSMNTYLTSRKSVGFLIMIHDRNRLADANMDGNVIKTTMLI